MNYEFDLICPFQATVETWCQYVSWITNLTLQSDHKDKHANIVITFKSILCILEVTVELQYDWSF